MIPGRMSGSRHEAPEQSFAGEIGAIERERGKQTKRQSNRDAGSRRR